MYVVVAQGPDPQHTSEWTPGAEPVICGRETHKAQWVIPWDRQISRQHFQIQLEGGAVRVTRLRESRNPLFYQNRPADDFEVRDGETFRAGQTIFQVRQQHREPVEGVTGYFNARELKATTYQQAAARLEALSGLPDLIRQGTQAETFYPALLQIMLNAIAAADAAAVIFVNPADPGTFRPRYWLRRGQAGHHPLPVSHRLIIEAIRTNSIAFYRWGEESGEFYTISGEFTWALCAPVLAGAGDRAMPATGEVQVLYVAGGKLDLASAVSETREESIRDDAKFVQLLAEVLGAFLQGQRLQTMGRYFPARVREIMMTGGNAALEPRLIDVCSVMFCDLRGFSKRAEEMARRGELNVFSEQIRDVLDIMTKGIHKFEGTVADLLGDAALGYWGWPAAQPSDFENACKAALEIAGRFDTKARQSSISGSTAGISSYRCAISIATGPAVVGELGARNLPKVTLLGPVVNLSSRLNGIAGILQVPIIVERPTIDLLPPDLFRVRRLGRVQPAKMDAVVEVFELLPPATDSPDALSADQVQCYEKGLECFEHADWNSACRFLGQLVAFDGPAQFLLRLVLGKSGSPKPPDWEGVIRLESKGPE